MKARIVMAGAVLILGGALLPAAAQDHPSKPPTAEREEKILDELDEARVREEILKMDLQNIIIQLQQWMQLDNQMRFAGLQATDSTEETSKQREEALKKAKHGRDEMTSAYMAVTRDLTRASRRRTELEKQISTQAGERVVKDNAAKPRAGRLIKAGGLYINPRQVCYVQAEKDEKGDSYVQVYFVGDKRLILKGQQADSLIEGLERDSR